MKGGRNVTHKEKVIASAYTGTLFCDFSDMHQYIEEKLGRPVFTHEMASKEIQDEIHEACKEDFLAMLNAEPTHTTRSNALDALDCVDTISRAEALEAISDLYWMDERLMNFRKEIDTTFDKVRDLPSAEPKRGRWIKMSDADGVYYACSECGEELYRAWTFDRQFDLFPKKTTIDKTTYCPNCGARMEEDENE